MARRAVPVDPSIGERIKTRRELRSWSIRYAASRAGIAHTTWMRIERGKLRTDRYMMADIAAALECAVTDLTGQPYIAADRALETAHARVEQVWRAMMAHPLTEPATCTPRPLDVLERDADLVRDLYNRCDYAGVLDRLVALVPELHATTHDGGAHAALQLMVPVYGVAMGSLLSLGYPAHAWLAVERCRDAAMHLEEPVAVAIAACNGSRVSASAGAYGSARSACARAAEELDRHTDEATALETLGFLHLARAHHSAGLKEYDTATDHLDEASRFAARTGETTSWDLSFGPSNVALWRMAVELDTGEPGRGIETAKQVKVAQLPATRQVAFYLDLARGLTDLHRDREATRMLLTAERIAPQYARSSTAARVTARTLLNHTGGSELRGLCERLGVAG